MNNCSGGLLWFFTPQVQCGLVTQINLTGVTALFFIWWNSIYSSFTFTFLTYVKCHHCLTYLTAHFNKKLQVLWHFSKIFSLWDSYQCSQPSCDLFCFSPLNGYPEVRKRRTGGVFNQGSESIVFWHSLLLAK